MPTRKFELYVGPTGTKGRILLDGEEVKNCRAVSIRTGVDELTTVALEIINVELVVHAEVEDGQPQIVEVTPLTAPNRIYQKV